MTIPPILSPQSYATARLQARRFNVIAKLLRERGGRGRSLSDEAIDCARAVLVDGRRQSDVAREYNKNRQQLHTWVRLFMDKHNELEQAKEGRA